jgi:diketogulonate reductase-like aldo/keto reductase
MSDAVGLTAAREAAAAPIAVANTVPIMTRPIPSSGEKLPVVGLGTAYQWRIDVPATHAALAEVVGTLIAGGGSVIDTAPDYGGYGVAEPMLGEIFAEGGLRQRIFIATKLEHTVWITQTELQASLQRLGVSAIDLIQVHNVVSAGQDLAPLRDWKARGLVRYIGITTSQSRYFDTVETVIRRWKPDFIQINCSLRDREAEQRLLPAAAELGVATLINMPFGGVEGRDGGTHGSLFSAVQGKPLPDWAREFDAASWGQFFLKYLLGNTAVTAVIPGTDKATHMADNLGAGRGRLPDAAQRQQMVRFISELG